jgi:hypothetical protein
LRRQRSTLFQSQEIVNGEAKYIQLAWGPSTPSTTERFIYKDKKRVFN